MSCIMNEPELKARGEKNLRKSKQTPNLWIVLDPVPQGSKLDGKCIYRRLKHVSGMKWIEAARWENAGMVLGQGM